MSRPLVSLVTGLLALALALPVAADDVHLTNGKVFTGVVARVEGETVAIHLPNGTLRLPAGRVERIERAATALEEYLARRRALVEGEAGAGDWLALARWARARGLDSGFREAARRAAAADPGLPELAPLMAELGFVREGPGPWLLPDELMARRGYVRHGDSWVTPGERAELLAAEAAAHRARLEARRDQRRDAVLADLAAAVRAQAEADARREARRDPGAAYGVPWAYTVSGYYVPVVVPVPVPIPQPPHQPPPAPPADPAPPAGVHHRNSFTDRVPGSLGNAFIPGRLEPGASPPPGRISARGSRH
jgi:hypothetical protein